MTKKRILLFVGQDITAHLIMNKVVSDMMAKGIYEPVIYLTQHAYSERAAGVPALREFGFFDRVLLNETVYPFIEDRPCISAQNMSPKQLADHHSLAIQDVANVNDPEFVESVRNIPNVVCGLSIRCTHIFKADIVDAVKQGRGDATAERASFVNLHSGLLPEYRGVMPTMRRMFDIASGNADYTDYGCTLHKVEPSIPGAGAYNGVDTGKIIEVKPLRLNPNHSGYMAQVSLAEAGADSINGLLTHISKYGVVRGYPQAPETSKYYTFPTRAEIKQWEKAGIVLVRRDEVLDTLVKAFSKASHPHGQLLRSAMETAVDKWCKEEHDSRIARRARFAPANDTATTTQAVDWTPMPRLAAC